jgi:hypothetical protein
MQKTPNHLSLIISTYFDASFTFLTLTHPMPQLAMKATAADPAAKY